MASYLDTYGAADLQRSRVRKRVAIVLLTAAVVALVLFLIFHNFREKRVVSRFLDTVRSGNYQQAYIMWGCTPAAPCRDYNFSKFMEDWGPKGQYANVKAARVTIVDSCGDGVVSTLVLPNTEPFGLWVERSTQVLSFAPWPRCPGRHLHLWEFLKSRFS